MNTWGENKMTPINKSIKAIVLWISLLALPLLSQAAPSITNIDPKVGTTGQVVNIAGSGFDGVTEVKFNGVSAGFRRDHSGWVSTSVPAGATSGYVTIVTTSGSATSPMIFSTGTTSTTVTTTSSSIIFSNMDPKIAGAGNWINIAGRGLSTVTQVRFNGTAARFRIDHDGWMSAEVPPGATNGLIALSGPSGTALSPSSFTTGIVGSGGTTTTTPPVTTTPVVNTGAIYIENFSPSSGGAGLWINISGRGFTGLSSVKFNGVAARSRFDHDGWISAEVPAGATSGKITVVSSSGTALSAGSFQVSGSTSTPVVTNPVVTPPTTTSGVLGRNQLAVIINDDDPQSVRVGDYYKRVRNIPDSNIIHVRMPVRKGLWAWEFEPIKRSIDAQTPSWVQGYAITWTYPFVVQCMSISSAISFGYSDRFCTSCNIPDGARSNYYDSNSSKPFNDFGMRPSMMLAGQNFDRVKELIDRGLASDGSRPRASVYMLQTNDELRSSRTPDMLNVMSSWSSSTGLTPVFQSWANTNSNSLVGKTDVFGYHTGLTHVPDILTNRFIPGGFADHMTSYGGVLNEDEGQMGILRWTEAGATGSYGTVVEPCAWTQKFPKTSVLLKHYYSGNTLLEAYWKSVQFPGEGVFIGDPLARPFGAAGQ
jgi:uncharacterized protein (TIGR03790 family)